MNSEIRNLFAELEPPPGGAERFAQRLDAEIAAAPAAARRRRRLAAAAACAAIGVLAAAFWLRERADPAPVLAGNRLPPVEVYAAPEFDRLLGRPLQAAEPTVSLGAQPLSVTRLDTANDKIRIYRIDEPPPPALPR